MSEHTGHRKRLRERALSGGLHNLEPHEVLELLLMETIPRRDVNPLAHILLRRFGSLAGVLDAQPEELMTVPGVGETTAAHLALQPIFYRYYRADRWGQKPQLNTFGKAGEYCTTLYDRQTEEKMMLVMLDAQQQVLSVRELTTGTVDETPLYTRQVVEYALRSRATSVILTHNHPSGDLTPSKADIFATEQVRQALELMNIRLTEHYIVAGSRYTSVSSAQNGAPIKIFDRLRPNSEPELLRAAEKKD